MENYLLISALCIATVGAVQDVRGGRIPNWLTYTGLLAALAVRFITWGRPGLSAGLFGVLLGGGIFYLLFLLGGMGGGDVKLIAAVSAWAGVAQTLNILIAAAIAGGILAVGYMLFHKNVRQTLVNTMELIRHHLQAGLRPHPEINVREPGTMRVPYGVAIAIGTFYCLSSSLWRG